MPIFAIAASRSASESTGAERRRGNLQLPEQGLLGQPVLRRAECRDRRQKRFRCRDFCDGFDGHVLDVECDYVDFARQLRELAAVVECAVDDAAHLRAGRVRALVEEHEAQSERIARQRQHATELARTDDADPHVCGVRLGSGWASTPAVCSERN